MNDRDQFADSIRTALGGRTKPDPVQEELDALRDRTIVLLADIEKVRTRVEASR